MIRMANPEFFCDLDVGQQMPHVGWVLEVELRRGLSGPAAIEVHPGSHGTTSTCHDEKQEDWSPIPDKESHYR
jgi:hypothetical protein